MNGTCRRRAPVPARVLFSTFRRVEPAHSNPRTPPSASVDRRSSAAPPPTPRPSLTAVTSQPAVQVQRPVKLTRSGKWRSVAQASVSMRRTCAHSNRRRLLGEVGLPIFLRDVSAGRALAMSRPTVSRGKRVSHRPPHRVACCWNPFVRCGIN
jgi:hypothetical protein